MLVSGMQMPIAPQTIATSSSTFALMTMLRFGSIWRSPFLRRRQSKGNHRDASARLDQRRVRPAQERKSQRPCGPRNRSERRPGISHPSRLRRIKDRARRPRSALADGSILSCLLQDVIEEPFRGAVVRSPLRTEQVSLASPAFLKAERSVRFNSLALARSISASTTNSSPAFLTEPLAASCSRACRIVWASERLTRALSLSFIWVATS